MTEHITFFIYGLCVMFYSMMVWMFYRKNKEKLSRLITCLMAILDMECLKDLLLFVDGIGAQSTIWYLMNAIDMVIIPFYMFVLMELVKPGWLTWGKGILHEAIFILPLAVYAFTRKVCWFDVLAGCGAVYGTVTYVLMFFYIARYQRQLKERFSYQENVNLHWLRGILTCFFIILIVWSASCYMFDVDFDNAYMLCSLVAWMVVSYFLYRHESVLDELQEPMQHKVMELQVNRYWRETYLRLSTNCLSKKSCSSIHVLSCRMWHGLWERTVLISVDFSIRKMD